jgi:hypothetical protein
MNNKKRIQYGEVKTQKDAVLWHLQKYGTITSLEAIKHYGCTRLASVIFNLKKEGYNICSIPIDLVNRFGRTVIISKYKLLEDSILTGQRKLF